MSGFGALLRQWRNVRRMSQLELASAAEVSSRHVSFVESGRSKPSREMVLRLATALDVPLRGQDELLEAAGFRATWRGSARTLDPMIDRVLGLMMEKHEPHPLVVFDCRFDILRANRGALGFLGAFLAAPPPQPLNIFDLVFDERYLKPSIASWDVVARHVLALARRELHRNPDDEALGMRLRALARTGFDLTPTLEPPAAFPFELARGDLRASFVTTLTTFSAPASVATDELRIETYFPLDDATDALCRQLSRA